VPRETLSYIGWLAASIAAAYVLLLVFWRTLGAYRLRRAGPRPLRHARHELWRDPGDVERLDLISGPGGRDFIPVPPYRFLEEPGTGSQPCVSVVDGRGRRWRVKWGQEVRCETFAVRLAWACGYFAEITHFIASGRIEDVGPLTRAAAACLDASGAFVDARFELDDPDVEKLFEEHSWSWTDNPFVGTRELAGLKILLMLLSNWDNKDQRDVARGSNTAIYVTRGRRHRHAQYLIVDWGGSMGRWGRAVVTRGRWDPAGFAAQTPQFVNGVDGGGLVQFGYTGQRTGDARGNIRVEDVAWLCRYLGRITDTQLCGALAASGATDEEASSFTTSLRARIDQLVTVAASPAPSPAPSTDLRATDDAGNGRAVLS
jgi:hypothetical protein